MLLELGLIRLWGVGWGIMSWEGQALSWEQRKVETTGFLKEQTGWWLGSQGSPSKGLSCSPVLMLTHLHIYPIASSPSAAFKFCDSKVLFRSGFSCWEKNGLNSSINSADSDLWRLWQYASIPFRAASGCQRSGWSRLGLREAESREWLGLCKVKVHALFNKREGPWHQLIVAAQVSTMDNAK